MIKPIRLVRLATADALAGERAAVVSIEPAAEGAFLIRVAFGASLDHLTTGTALGPINAVEVPHRVEEVLKRLAADGFIQAEGADLILALESPKQSVRGRAAVRLGWRREKRAVAPLMLAAERAKGDICPIVDALGIIGDPAAIELARGLAKKKNLSRRRSGVEALRNLGDAQGLAEAKQAAQDRLPPTVMAVLAEADESKVDEAAVAAIVKAVDADDPRKRGLVADVLYERDTPLAVRVASKLLEPSHLRKPHVWRYAKSVLKRAMIREDPRMVGRLAYRVERASIGYPGETATVKSGLDGEKRTMRIFGPKTQKWVRRATWRYMRDLARYRPAKYVVAAVTVLSSYGPEDAGDAKKGFGAFADAFLLHRILHARSDRYVVRWPTLRHQHTSSKAVDAPAGIREEAFPAVWDAHPEAFLRLLGRARLREVQDFALDGLVRHPDVLRRAKVARLVDVVALGRLEATALVVQELDRRFDAAVAAGDPGWKLIVEVLDRPHPDLSDLVLGWLGRSAQAWTGSAERLFAVLEAQDAKVRLRAAPLAVAYVRSASPAFRAELATRVLARLREGEEESGRHAGLSLLARDALASELEAILDLDALLELVREGSHSAKQLAGSLLGRRDDALAVLGLEGLLALADHEVAAVRAAGHAILRGAGAPLARDPSPLFALAESQWQDTQLLSFELLRAIPLASLGLEGLIGLCDSTQPAVQALGRELVVRHFEELDAEQVLFRLSEHPARAMRAYALELIETHLRPGVVPLMRLDGFFRACLLDMRPARELKHGVLEFVTERGLADARQGEHVAALLADVLRTHTRSDFDRVSEALARLQVAHPEVRTDLRLLVTEAAE